MSKAVNILIVILVLTSISFASAVTERTVVKKELIDSQYGIITEWLGIGDKFYRVTYSDGTTEEIAVTSGSLLKMGAITELQSTSVSSSVCYSAKINFRVKTVQDSANSFTNNHKIEIWYNPMIMSLNLLKSEATNNPQLKIYESPSFTASTTSSVPYTLEIPYRYVTDFYSGQKAYAPNQDYVFMVVEYQQRTNGEWIVLYNPEWGTTTTYLATVKWWDTYQSGGGTGSLMTGTCQVAPPTPPAATTPTPTPSSKTIKIISDPTGATVISSGTTLGTTPFDLTLSGNEAKILTFSKDGYNSVGKGIAATSGSPYTVVLTPITSTTPVPAVTTIPPLVTTVPPTSTTTTVPPNTDSGDLTLETEPLQNNGDVTVKYEDDTLFGITTASILFLIIILVGVIGYMKLGKKKGRKGK